MEKIEVRGDPNLSQTPVSAKTMMRKFLSGVEAYYVVLDLWNAEIQEQTRRIQGMTGVLVEFAELFGEINEMSPKRWCDHGIVIKEGAQILNIRPYRYPHDQKDAIEKFVRDMLAACMIRPSVGPYSSLLILV